VPREFKSPRCIEEGGVGDSRIPPCRRWQRALRCAVVVVAAAGIAGCVNLTVQASDGSVRVERSVGILRVELASPEQEIVGSVSGLGVVSAPMGVSVGYTQQRWALVGPRCRVVIFPDAGMPDAKTRAELERIAGLCLVLDENGNTVAETSKEGRP
jgi:hypothetical protein